MHQFSHSSSLPRTALPHFTPSGQHSMIADVMRLLRSRMRFVVRVLSQDSRNAGFDGHRCRKARLLAPEPRDSSSRSGPRKNHLFNRPPCMKRSNNLHNIAWMPREEASTLESGGEIAAAVGRVTRTTLASWKCDHAQTTSEMRWSGMCE